MIQELEERLPKKFFCGKCEQYVDKIITYTEIKWTSYVTTRVCLICFRKLCEGKIE